MLYTTTESWQMRNMYIWKYNLILLFVDGDAYVGLEINRGESSCTRRSRRESELPAGTDFSQKPRPNIVLKFLRNPHAMLIFHWPGFSPMQSFLFIGHGLHQRNACSLLVTDHTYAFLVSGNQYVEFIFGWKYLSTTSAGFIAGLGDILHRLDDKITGSH